MRNKIYIIMCSIFIAIYLCGCTATIYGLSTGMYAIEGKKNIPQIEFNLSEHDGLKNGFFCYTAGEQSIQGTIDIDNGDVICTSQDGEAKYVFEIIDNVTITFEAKKSSNLYMEDGITQIQDGMEFIYVDEY